MRRDLYFIHAAALALSGRAFLLVAASGKGKSTTTWALLHHGFDYLSDEMAPLDLNATEVQPYPHAICLNGAAFSLFLARESRADCINFAYFNAAVAEARGHETDAAGGDFFLEYCPGLTYPAVAAAYLYLLLSYLDRNRLVRIAPEILQELSLSQPSFSRISLEAAHAIIDRYFVAGKVFGGLLSERNVTIIWNTLTLPAPALPNLMLVPVNLSLPHHYRIQ